MHDLNDFYYFHAVVTHHGFSAAARHIGVPKATLSKAVTRLEERLQVRLLERSTRRLRTTEAGRLFYEQCSTMLAGIEGAEAVAAQVHAEPQGIVRVSCHQGLIQDLIADLLPEFMMVHPKVRVQMKVLNRHADLIEDGVDVALRARMAIEEDASLIVRPLGRSRLILAMNPALRGSCDELTVERLTDCPTLSMADETDEDTWNLVGPADEEFTIRHRPRLLCSNFDMLRAAAIKGLGVALLPEHICRPCFASGELIHVLPDWHTRYGIIYAVLSSRKGLMPAVRTLIDYLAVEVARRSSDHPGPRHQEID